MYTDFAKYYDTMMADVDYTRWACAIRDRLISLGVKPGMRICECACGTGNLTIPLAEMGYSICGVDLSGDMLSAAMDKSRKKGLSIPYVRQDMTGLDLPRNQDAILCTCDGINYLTSKGCGLFFRRAFQLLRTGGVLLFDLSTPYKLTYILGDHTLHRTDDEYCYIWENSLSGSGRRLTIHLTAFVRTGDNCYARFEEDQTQYVHDLEDITQTLAEAGFVSVEALNGTLTGPAETDNERWHFVAIRP